MARLLLTVLDVEGPALQSAVAILDAGKDTSGSETPTPGAYQH